jgi:CheY-like chemotaxis protein
VDIVVCDLMLPDVSDAEIFEAVSSQRPALARHFLFVTGGAVDEPAKALLDRPEARWLQKPVDPLVLHREVARIANAT